MSDLKITLDNLVAREYQNRDRKLSQVLENISKITDRIAVSTGAEKERLQGLLEVHNSNKVELENIDPTQIAITKFTKLNSNK